MTETEDQPPPFELNRDTINQEVMDHYRTGDYDRAVNVAKKSLVLAEKNVGPDHPDVAWTLNILAFLYKTQGQYGRAEPLFSHH